MTGKQMIDDEQIERNKLAAARGWLADPPPPAPSPQPHDRVDKWRRMYGQLPPNQAKTLGLSSGAKT